MELSEVLGWVELMVSVQARDEVERRIRQGWSMEGVMGAMMPGRRDRAWAVMFKQGHRVMVMETGEVKSGLSVPAM